jgi:hypothetical protein
VKVDPTIGSTAIGIQNSDENCAIRKSDSNAKVVCKGTSDKHPPRETEAMEARAKSDQQGFESQIEQEWSKGVPLADPAGNRHRSNRVIIVHEKGGGIGVSDRKGVLDKGGKAELGEDCGKVRVGDPVVCFLLVEEDQRTVHRVIRMILFSGVPQDLANSHSDISCLAITNKASLVRRDKLRKNSRKASGKDTREDLDITIGKRDRTPIGNVREITIWFWNQ